MHGRTRRRRAGIRLLLRVGGGSAAVLAWLLFGSASPVRGQQFVTDDAAVTDYGACQFEGWIGESAGWFLPACRLIRPAEITLGVGRVADDSRGHLHLVLQAKSLILAPRPNRPGMGLVAGVGVDRLDQIVGHPLTSGYVYLPVSLPLAEERLVLHQNVGWRVVRNGSDDDLRSTDLLTWASRADLVLNRRLTAIAELFGENLTSPQYQIGLRATLVPDRVLMDVSFGGHTARGEPGAGYSVGAAWAPAAFR